MDLEAARALWSRGSYAISGDWFAEASRACLAGLELDGVRLLDVACGTGAVALEAARRGARVVGLDATPAMLEEARRRAGAEVLAVEWREGSFTDLGAFRGFDVVASAFGVIFAEDQAAVAEGLLRAARPRCAAGRHRGSRRSRCWRPGASPTAASP